MPSDFPNLNPRIYMISRKRQIFTMKRKMLNVLFSTGCKKLFLPAFISKGCHENSRIFLILNRCDQVIGILALDIQ
jgi:hypothetical protein